MKQYAAALFIALFTTISSPISNTTTTSDNKTERGRSTERRTDGNSSSSSCYYEYSGPRTYEKKQMKPIPGPKQNNSGHQP